MEEDLDAFEPHRITRLRYAKVLATLTEEQISALLNLFLVGDYHEAPLTPLGKWYVNTRSDDIEAQTCVGIAAALLLLTGSRLTSEVDLTVERRA